MKSRKQFVRNMSLLLVSFAIGYIPMATSAQDNDSERQQEKLTAFAKTFGYVRYFHPSDQASLVDWNSMAVYGARETLNSAADESTGRRIH